MLRIRRSRPSMPPAGAACYRAGEVLGPAGASPDRMVTRRCLMVLNFCSRWMNCRRSSLWMSAAQPSTRSSRICNKKGGTKVGGEWCGCGCAGVWGGGRGRGAW